jgi:uroporphyrin-III C-methyltransferase/precorrin-2 dehydrogenase/sirohydrochlorin ferrochelatase
MNAIVRKPEEKNPTRIGSLSRLPVFLSLEGKRAVVMGGAAAAAWKVELLLAAGATVEVYAAEASEEMLAAVASPPRGVAALYPRDWSAIDLEGAEIAVGAFENDQEAWRFAAAARSAGIPVNVIDKPAFSDFTFGSIVNRSPLVIGISTDGAAPVFAQAIRAKLEAMLPQGFARWAEAALRWRPTIKASGLSFANRRKVWQLFTALALKNPNHVPEEADLTHLLDDIGRLGTRTDAGSVVLVGAGPGDPELLTLRAVRALQSADAILFDDLVSSEILDFARREAKKILVGKTGFGPSCKQQDINALMVGLARGGRCVVRLKGGDPLMFARAAEEIDACRNAGIPVEIVPGITAAQGAASRLGIPLTGRGRARRVQFVTGHAQDGRPLQFDWRSFADASMTTALYMPRHSLAQFVASVIDAGLPADTPSIAISSATRTDEYHIKGPIHDLPRAVDASELLTGPLLVLFGAALKQETSSIPAPVRTRRSARFAAGESV